jgi:hypothetical protein
MIDGGAAPALMLVSTARQPMVISDGMLRWASQPDPWRMRDGVF